MKKIWLMLLMVCGICAFNACSDDDNGDGSGDGDGSEQVIVEVEMKDTIVVGQKVVVKGKGFKTSAKLYLGDVKLDATLEADASGVSFILADDFQPGVYELSVEQDGKKVVLKKEVVVEKADDMTGKVKSITLAEKDGLNETFEFVYVDGKMATIRHTYPMDEEGDDDYEEYSMSKAGETQTDEINITYEGNTIIVNPLGGSSYTYNLENGKVVSGVEEGWTLDEFGMFWTYDGDYLQSMDWYGDYVYEGGNLVECVGDKFDFTGAEYRNIEGFDLVAWMYFSNYAMYYGDLSTFMPQILNVCGKTSEYLPVEHCCVEGEEEKVFDVNYTLTREKITGVSFKRMNGMYESECKITLSYY
ncbi:MAG: hypothetical protein ACLTSL_00395 [Odoribacter splanchnicus]